MTYVSPSFFMNIIRDRNTDRNKGNAIDNKVSEGQAGAHARQHGKLCKLEIVSQLYLKRIVIFLTLKMSSMLSN